MSESLVLQVVLPLIAAPLCVLFRSARIAAAIAVAVALALLANSISLFSAVDAGETVAHAFGDFAAPLGIEYRLDAIGAYFLVIVASVVAVSTWWAAAGVSRELGSRRIDRFFALWLLCIAGSNGMVLSADAFHIFVCLEISSLSSYALVAQGPNRWSLVAAFRYLLAGTIGASFVLIGIGLLYSMTGTLGLEDLAARLPAVADSPTVRAGWAFIGVGLCLKAAVFPLHLWLPDAYSSAPTAVSAMLGGIATKIAILLWIRFFFVTFSPAVPFNTLLIDEALLALGLAGVLVGAAIAAAQSDPKRLLAWSSVSQVGYMIAGLALGSLAGLNATVTHALHHATIKSAAFLALGCVALRVGAGGRPLTRRDLTGLGRRMPFVAGALVIVAAGLIGMPLTAGFTAKWLLLEAMLEQDRWLGVVVLALGSLLAAVYAWRLIEPMYSAPDADAPRDVPIGRGRRLWLVLPIVVATALSIWYGVVTDFSVDAARAAVSELLGGGR